jgi:Mn-dependent DtxR family transcriptional regulator
MSDELIPEDVRQFILTYIESIAQLEALMLLRREPQAAWNASTVARRLYVDEAQAAEALGQLAAAGLVVANDDARYRFNDRSKELGEIADRLLDLYNRHLIPVTNLVHGKPRVRAFADAFKLRKDR